MPTMAALTPTAAVPTGPNEERRPLITGRTATLEAEIMTDNLRSTIRKAPISHMGYWRYGASVGSEALYEALKALYCWHYTMPGGLLKVADLFLSIEIESVDPLRWRFTSNGVRCASTHGFQHSRIDPKEEFDKRRAKQDGIIAPAFALDFGQFYSYRTRRNQHTECRFREELFIRDDIPGCPQRRGQRHYLHLTEVARQDVAQGQRRATLLSIPSLHADWPFLCSNPRRISASSAQLIITSA